MLLPYGDVFEFLASFIESMQLDPPWSPNVDPIKYLVDIYQTMMEKGELTSIKPDRMRMSLLLLYRLGLVRPCKSSKLVLDNILVCPVSTLDDPKKEIEVKILSWHPVRLLLRYLALKGGYASIDDVVRDLGCTVKRLTCELHDALKPLVPRPSVLQTPEQYLDNVREYCGIAERRGVLKPFNKARISKLLAPLLQSLGYITLNDDYLELTDLGWKAAFNCMTPPREELVATLPLLPQLYAALLAVLYKSSKILYMITPWIDDIEFLGKLLRVAAIRGSKRITLIVRDTKENRELAYELVYACEKLGLNCSILALDNLHAKIYMSTAALVSSANLLRTSLGRNYELGVYYPVTTPNLHDIVREMEEVAIRLI